MKKILIRASRLLAIFLPLALFLLPIITLAQSGDPLGVDYMEGTGLSKQDPRITVARFIQVGLGFLGTIAVVLVIYAGFIWMTSEGNAEKIKKAKDLLKSAAIGLLIILSSFAIVTFVINKLNEAIGGSGGQQSVAGGNDQNGLAAIGSGIIQSVYPEPWQNDVPRNTSVIVTFREKIKVSTICQDGNDASSTCANSNIVTSSVKFFQTEVGDSAATNLAADKVKVSTSDGKIFVFTPVDYFGSANSKLWQSVKLTDSVKKANGSAAFTLGNFTWQFEVGTKVDLTPPQVQLGGIVPAPDNEADIRQGVREAVQAVASLTFSGQIQVARTATATEPQAVGLSGTARLQGNYNCSDDGTVTVTIASTTPMAAQVTGTGVAREADAPSVINDNDVSDNQVNLGCGLTLIKVGTLAPGNSWTFNVLSAKSANSLTIGNQTYHFVATADNNPNNISVASSTAEKVAQINATNNQVIATSTPSSPNTIGLLAAQAGEIGNSLTLLTDSSALRLTQFSGGIDRQEQIEIKGAPDIPRNSVLQINFSEAINPMTVVGTSDQVSSTIRVLNASTSQPIAGKFMIGNQYKTLEFVSNDECGTNACGDTIYCLPANTNVIVQLGAANLNPCTDSQQCVDKTPYSQCVAGFCQKDTDDRYPMAALPLASGVVDACFNSLDGNRDTKAFGPVGFYSENTKNADQKDSYQWSFFVNDNIDLTPPKLINNSLSPAVSQSSVALNQLIEFSFDKIMMATTLGSGSVNINNHQHQLINLYSAGAAPSFWVTSQAIDSGVPDGYPDYTKIKVLHGLLSEATRYSMEVGSGVKDSRQNCFKPCSDNAACTSTVSSCCSGQPSAATSCQ